MAYLCWQNINFCLANIRKKMYTDNLQLYTHMRKGADIEHRSFDGLQEFNLIVFLNSYSTVVEITMYFHLSVQSWTKLYKVVQKCTKLYKVLQKNSKLFKVVQVVQSCV